MLAVLISGSQITNDATTQIRDTKGKNELGKTTNFYFIVILGAILDKESIEKEICAECARFNTNQRSADQARTMIK